MPMAIHYRNTSASGKMVTPARLTALVVSVMLASAVVATAAFAVPKKPGAAGHATKGQSQISGSFGRFNTVYTLKDQMNYEILSADYTLDPFVA
jgi:hypothetical protein